MNKKLIFFLTLNMHYNDWNQILVQYNIWKISPHNESNIKFVRLVYNFQEYSDQKWYAILEQRYQWPVLLP